MAAALSVILCTKNRLEDLKIAVRSLAEQSRLPDELIVIDASEDEAVRAWLETQALPFHAVCFHTAPGLTYQRNIGIRKSTGELLFFFDDDVRLDPGCIAALEQAFLDDPDGRLGAVGARILDPSPPEPVKARERFNRAVFSAVRVLFMGSRLGSGRFQFSGMPTHPHRLLKGRQIQCLSGCCMAFRRQVFDTARFDEKLTGYGQMEDADISLQTLSAGWRIYYQPSAVLEHRVSPQDRLKAGSMAEITALHYTYLFRKHLPQTFFRQLSFLWTLCGLFLLYGRTAPGRQGLLRGLRRAKVEMRAERPGAGGQS